MPRNRDIEAVWFGSKAVTAESREEESKEEKTFTQALLLDPFHFSFRLNLSKLILLHQKQAGKRTSEVLLLTPMGAERATKTPTYWHFAYH